MKDEAEYLKELESRVRTVPIIEKVVEGTEDITMASPEDIAVKIVEILEGGAVHRMVIEVGKPIVVFEYDLSTKATLLSPDALKEAKSEDPVETVYPVKGDM